MGMKDNLSKNLSERGKKRKGIKAKKFELKELDLDIELARKKQELKSIGKV